ncbi:hypothetical protein Mgra_00007518 [Meloidogyne graminicola]|uniref:Rel homology dimerisation domain-containing protein n=1 Tax=Meloidogyne graminicola TaxID=189291 RepID=A0A8S9ZID7_9BILA|nr:hypothetical protein Mgra_00007518 [Meloidogyne graminicola]
MIGILDCIGIMKICAYNNNYEYKKHLKCRKRSNNNKIINENEYKKQKENNIIYIVAKAFIPLENNEKQINEQKFEIIQTISEPIKCVHQLGNPDILKISFDSCTSNGGQELFIIGRNFDPKNTKVLFREYKNDGLLGWSAEAKIDKKYLHQCYIVCTIPPYKRLCQGGIVSLTIICGTKQSHPINFLYKP